MIKYLQKDLTTIECGVIIHGCNAQGVMGSGVALALRTKWPQIFKSYRTLCEAYNFNHQLLGCVDFVTVNSYAGKEVVVGNIITQQTYGKDGRRYADPKAIDMGLEQACMYAKHLFLPLYMPRIGCSLGGLNWEKDVEPIVEYQSNVNMIPINVCDI
jgi:O-acetyl-ADP-ribose deacetylase (regulator of RNase III)